MQRSRIVVVILETRNSHRFGLACHVFANMGHGGYAPPTPLAFFFSNRTLSNLIMPVTCL